MLDTIRDSLDNAQSMLETLAKLSSGEIVTDYDYQQPSDAMIAYELELAETR